MITQQQIKTLTGKKCPECNGNKVIDTHYLEVPSKCKSCNGTGLPTIEIEKEICLFPNTNSCDCKEYKVGDIIFIHKPTGKEVIGLKPTEDYEDEIVKLKIISETETHWKVQRVK